jgi:hypothetical protein
MDGKIHARPTSGKGKKRNIYGKGKKDKKGINQS